MKILNVVLLFVLSSMMLSSLEAKTLEERLHYSNGKGDTINIGLTPYKNSFGELEVRVDAAGMPKLLDRLNPTIAFGRDLDDDHKIDTWFILTSKGIEIEQIQGKDDLGRDVLGKILFKKHPTSAKLYFSTATTTILSFLLLTAKESTNKEAAYIQEWINLEDMRLRLEREVKSESNTLTRDQVLYQYALISKGFNTLAEDMDHFIKAGFWEWAGADVGLWISGSFIFKTAASIMIKTGAYITETSVYLTYKEELTALVSKTVATLKEKGATIGNKIGLTSQRREEIQATSIAKMSAFKIKMTVAATITSDIAKNRLTKIATAAIKWPMRIASGARSEWQYISLSTGIQLASETAAHYDDVYDPNPLIMAKNVLTNEDILQNIGFMTADTILMTGISKNLKTTKARFLASGFIGLHDSVMINLVIKDEDNYKRVAMDTAWESIIGNAQVQIDLKALETFEKLAVKNNNPRLKLLGYAVVLLDQGAGYFFYSKAADSMKDQNNEVPVNSKEAPVKLVPVFANID